LLSSRISPPPTITHLPYTTLFRSAQLFDRIQDDLAALPGVVDVASSMVGVIAGNSWGGNVTVQGFEAAPDADTDARYNAVSEGLDRKSTRLNSSHVKISYAVFCLK